MCGPPPPCKSKSSPKIPVRMARKLKNQASGEHRGKSLVYKGLLFKEKEFDLEN